MLKEKLNRGLLPALVLVLVTLTCTLLLALTQQITAGAILAQEEGAKLASKQKLFPQGESFVALELTPELSQQISSADKALAADGTLLGLIVKAEARGYAGPVPIYLAFSLEGEIVGVDLPQNNETPGLGQKVRDEAFAAQFVATRAGATFSAKPHPAGDVKSIDAIAGATISSQAVCEAATKAGQALLQLLKGVN